MPLYESVFIARQDVSSAQVEAMADTFTKVIEERGGTVAKRENWGLRNLAYRIKKNRKGHYVLLNLDAPPEAVREVERQMHINEDVIRYLTVRVEELEAGPSAVILNKGREDRPRREDRFRRDERPFREGREDRPFREGREDRPFREGREGREGRGPGGRDDTLVEGEPV